MMLSDCGVAQVFDFTVDGEKIWFTEWVENNIGVVDTSIPLPFEIQLESDVVTLKPGDSIHFNFIVSPISQEDLLGVSLVLSSDDDLFQIDLDHDTPEEFQLDNGIRMPIHTTISASENAVSGTYKILLGGQTSNIAIGKFVTVTIE